MGDVTRARLPEGQTCRNCAHIERCKWLIKKAPTSTLCDWDPSRFRIAAAVDGDDRCPASHTGHRCALPDDGHRHHVSKCGRWKWSDIVQGVDVGATYERRAGWVTTRNTAT